MDSTRFILLTSWLVVLLLLYQAWQQDYAISQTSADTPLVEPMDQSSGDVPGIPAADTASASEVPLPLDNSNSDSRLIEIHTDVFRLLVDTRGAGVVRAELKQFPVSLDQADAALVLMDRTRELYYISQGGLLSNLEAPTHETLYQSGADTYALADNADTLEVPFTWRSGNGLTVTKTYVLQRGRYLLDIRYEIANDTGAPWTGWMYEQIKRNNPGRSSMFGTYTYTGAVVSSPENRYEKISFNDIEDQEQGLDISDGWVAMIQHYFLTALIPGDKTETYHFYTRSLSDGNFAIGMRTPPLTVAPAAVSTTSEQLYIGPKAQEDLKQITDGLDLTVDYGFLWFLAKPLFWCLDKFHELTGNWGWSIILLTVMLKLVFYPLSAAGYRSMANMRKIQPRLMALRDRYKDDKARMNQALMQMYKEEKINPMGGCFPILVQIPVFLALYWVLLESVEMRQSGFIFWIQDLSSPDPYFILPLVMGITMFIQQKLNPAPLDPVQAKVMSVLPVVFTVFFAFFQSGLVLYWVVNNILSIAQQWMIVRNLEKAGVKTSGS